MNRFWILVLKLCLLVLLLPTAGCITYQGHDPRIDRPAEVGGSKRSMARRYRFHYVFRHTEDFEDDDHVHDDPELEETYSLIIQKVLKRDSMVSDSSPIGRTLEMDLVVREDTIGVLNLISGLTLFVLPTWASNDIRLRARLLDSGKVLMEMEEKSDITTLYQFFFLFAMPFTDGYYLERNIRYLTENLVRRMRLEWARRQ